MKENIDNEDLQETPASYSVNFKKPLLCVVVAVVIASLVACGVIEFPEVESVYKSIVSLF